MSLEKLEDHLTVEGLIQHNQYISSFQDVMRTVYINQMVQKVLVDDINLALFLHQKTENNRKFGQEDIIEFHSRLGDPVDLLKTLNLVRICQNCSNYSSNMKMNCGNCQEDLLSAKKLITCPKTGLKNVLYNKYLQSFLGGTLFGIMIFYLIYINPLIELRIFFSFFVIIVFLYFDLSLYRAFRGKKGSLITVRIYKLFQSSTFFFILGLNLLTATVGRHDFIDNLRIIFIFPISLFSFTGLIFFSRTLVSYFEKKMIPSIVYEYNTILNRRIKPIIFLISIYSVMLILINIFTKI